MRANGRGCVPSARARTGYAAHQVAPARSRCALLLGDAIAHDAVRPQLEFEAAVLQGVGWLQGLGWLVLLARTSWQAVHLASTQLLGIDRDLRRNRIRLQRREDQVEATSRWCARTAMASSATPRMLIADNSGSLLSTSASAEHAQTVVGRINRTHGPMRRSPNCRLGTA